MLEFWLEPGVLSSRAQLETLAQPGAGPVPEAEL